ncbi:DUF6054 family protein [Thermotalea metallivorans]|uniref:Uncharacterized protein n=1 Tax=Thermotalea metallivorans TaxID=520762 RepID=A0A140KZH0_9FIRM|nr:DUF6054 family protein [Thermotalea metallivorans]KXG73695.1 hypothetical protein AN619_29900 [Thermotalea metallivorans]
MSIHHFQISIDPVRAFHLVKENENAELVYEEIHDLGGDQYIGTLVFEKYFFRTSNRAALVVIIDNIKGQTAVRAIATGSSQGLLFNFDWGAANDFAYSVKAILQDFIVE